MPEMNKWQERENAIVNSIMSGQNSCGTLAVLATQGGKALEDFLRMMVRATLQVCNQEENRLLTENHTLRADNETKRFGLESVVANIAIDNPAVLDALRKALPGHPHLKGN